MEKVGEQQRRGGQPERVFALTDDGTAFVEEYLVDTDEAPDAYAVKIERALNENEKLRGRINELERTAEQQAEMIEKLQEQKVDESRFEGLLDRLRGDYRKAIVDEMAENIENHILSEE